MNNHVRMQLAGIEPPATVMMGEKNPVDTGKGSTDYLCPVCDEIVLASQVPGVLRATGGLFAVCATCGAKCLVSLTPG